MAANKLTYRAFARPVPLTRLRASSGEPDQDPHIQKIFSGRGKALDVGKVIHRGRDGQGATRKYYRKKDGSLAVVIEIEAAVFEFGKLIAVPDRTIINAFEDALRRSRAALRTGVEAGDTLMALAVFEAAVDAALGLLREGLDDASREEPQS